jgi:DNA repair exonuclease SbcCD ATPase subunit
MKATNIILIVLIVVSAVLAGLLVSSQNKLGKHNAIVQSYEEKISELEATHNNMLEEKDNLMQTISDFQKKEQNYIEVQNQLYKIANITKSNKQSLANIELDPDYSTNQSLQNLEKNQNELKKLRNERGLLYAEINSLKNDLNSSSADKEKIQSQINKIQAELDRTDVMISNLEQSITQSQGIIAKQKEEINTIYYVIGSKDELREMGITSNEGGVLWGLLGSIEIVRNDFNIEKFTPKNLAVNDEIEIKAYIDDINIYTKQHETAYELVEVSKDITVLKVKDHEQFRKDKHVVIEID